MPLYEFRRLDGAIVEARFGFEDVPSIGESVVLEEHGLCTRIVSEHQSGVRRNIEPFTSISVPPFEGKDEGWHHRYDEDPKSLTHGQPIFASRREAEAFQARSEGKWTFDGLPASCESRHRADLKQVAKQEGLL